jgi:hypothetical protein
VNRASRISAAALVVLGLVLYCVTKPVHVDDTNFLRLAEGAAQDPWRPHDITINWLGTTQRAFDILSNPPGIAYWLVPVRNAPEWVMHLWMLPWLALALFGTARVARAFEVPEERAILLLGTAPVFVLAAQSLTPDLPLLACALAGIGGFMTATDARRACAWAFVAGCAALFKYSGICMVPLLVLAGLQRGRWRESLLAALPIALLFLHDLHAYGQIHMLAMVGFQGISDTRWLVFHKLVAALAMLGGACLLPVLPWRLGALPFAAAGALLGAVASHYSHHDAQQLATTVLSSAAGGLALGSFRLRAPDDRFLAIWLAGGLAFLLTLMFMATRYWLPFMPAAVFAALRRDPSNRRFGIAVGLGAALSLALAHDDDGFARGYRDAAREIAQSSGEKGLFIGHWGWQYYMEQGGWRALELYEHAPGRLAVAFAPWPQRWEKGQCFKREPARVLESSWPIRVHSRTAAANFHSFLISGTPELDTYAPWGFSTEPYDEVSVLWSCEIVRPR